jgi:hypothetical protein
MDVIRFLEGKEGGNLRQTYEVHDIVSGEKRIARDGILGVDGKNLIQIETGSIICVDSFAGSDWATIRHGNQTVKVFVVDLVQRTAPHD